MLNPDSSICMNRRYSPGLLVVWALCFAEDSILYHENSVTNFVIIVDMFVVLVCCAKISLVLPVISNILFQLAMKGMSKSTSRPNTAAPGEALRTV